MADFREPLICFRTIRGLSKAVVPMRAFFPARTC
jgi:hypothetical protein